MTVYYFNLELQRMKLFCLLVLCFQPLDLVCSQNIPASYTYTTTDIVSVNGSSATGHCSSVTTNSDRTTTCTAPSSSVLFDRNIPTLTGLDGNMWASQLLIVQPTTGMAAEITFDFSNNQNFRVERLEMVIFNCPQWGAAVQTFRLLQTGFEIGTITPTITSCDSLVRVCTSVSSFVQSLSLKFSPRPGSEWVYLAELRFWGNSYTCPTDTIITTPTLVLPDTTLSIQGITSLPPDTTLLDTTLTSSLAITGTTQCEVCPSCSTPTILASVITAILTVLLATVVSVLVQIAICKYRPPKSTPGGGISAGEEEQVYEQVDGGEGGVAVSDPTYMEVGGGGGGGGSTFELKRNEAYATHKN